eukprot:7656382-Alexandrium_andersonii.AAC.1
MPAEAALSLTDPEYRTMARTRLAMPVISSRLTCAKCRAALGPLGLHSHTCPGQTRRRTTLPSEPSGRNGPTMDSQ